ncbi:MAG: hypothetical protein ACODAD_00635 [Planctomycetota bacterium]
MVSMRRLTIFCCPLVWAAACSVGSITAAQPLDLRQGVPDDVFLVVQKKHNPERDFQQAYYEEVWDTIRETRITERALEIATAQMGEDDQARVDRVIEEFREAAEPIDIRALINCEELIYAQRMLSWQPEELGPSLPTSQHLALVRTTPEAASSTAEGMKNLFALAEKYSDGGVHVEESREGNASLATLVLPPQSPIQPTIAYTGEVLMLCSSKDLLLQSLGMMTEEEGTSKFDDPRLQAALGNLPEVEDGLVFYDGRLQFDTLKKIGPAVGRIGGGDPNVERFVKLYRMIMDEVAVFDHEVTVEYTEDNLNRSAAFGKWMPGSEDTTLRKMLSQGEPFEPWQRWVPAGSLSYSLGTGVNLHVLYQRVMEVLKEDIPEASDALAAFEQMQEELDVYLDRDILQAFSGEYVTVAVVTENGNRESVTALRCHKPERIRELVQRGVEAARQTKWVKPQQLKLEESQSLEEFEEVSAAILNFFGFRPVIGFENGWMYVGQSTAAVKRILETKAGNAETIDTTDAFKRLALSVEGPVNSMKYANTAENMRATADALRKGGFAFHMALTMAGVDATDQSLEPVRKLLALLPDVAKIIEAFDFLEAKLTVVQDGPGPDSYTKESVTVVRPPEETP